MFDGSRSITLPKFLKDTRNGFNEAYVSKGIALVKFERLVSKKADRLCSSHVSADVQVTRTTGSLSWPDLVQTHLQR